MARADFVTSLVLIVFGLGVVAESWRMPRFTEFGSSIWSAPGVVPAMIGAALTVMGAALFVRSRAAAPTLDRTDAGPSGADVGTIGRVLLAFALCLGFAGILVGRVPFLPAAFVFILAFTLIFDLNDTPEARSDWRRLARRGVLALAVAGIASFAIATIFEDIFLVRLP